MFLQNIGHMGYDGLELTEEQQPFLKMVRRLVEDRVTPWAAEIDETDEFPSTASGGEIAYEMVPKEPKLIIALIVAYLVAVPAISSAASPVKSIFQTTRDLRKAWQINEDPSVPDDPRIRPAARTLLKKLKHQLRDLLLDTINAQDHRIRSPERLKSNLLAKLKKSSIPVGGYEIGDITGISIQRPERHPNLLAFTTTLGILCGNDTSLYLAKRRGTRWELILALEANDYKEINGAQGSFEYAILPPDLKGDFFVVTVDINPWCTSFWQAIRYKVFRVGSKPYRPKRIMSRKETVYEGNDLVYRLSTESKGFTLSFTGETFASGTTRQHVARYAVVGDQVRRVAPIALEPQDFLDEWISLPWKEASRWSEPSVRSGLRGWHAKLKQNRYSEQYDFELSFVQSCGKKPGKWQIGLDIHAEGVSGPLPPKLFFTIVQKGKAYSMQDIHPVRSPGCLGESSPHGPDGP